MSAAAARAVPTPAWAVGMERIGPGVYVDREGTIDIDDVGVCGALGWLDTPETRRAVHQATREAICELYPDKQITIREVED